MLQDFYSVMYLFHFCIKCLSTTHPSDGDIIEVTINSFMKGAIII